MSAVCLQRPNMGSSQPPDGNAPFGYHIPEDFLFLRAPTPPPGDPLLGQDDSRVLSLFFEDMASNQYPTSYGEGLNFSEQWISQLPPSFLGHSTSFGQQPQQPSALPMNGMPATNYQDVFTFGQNLMPPPPQTPSQPQPQPSLQLHQQHQHPQQQLHHQYQQHNIPPPSPHTPVDQNAHADVAAVLTSLHHGYQNSHHNGHSANENAMSHAPVVPSQHLGAPADHMRSPHRNHVNHRQNGLTQHRQSPSTGADNLFTDMMFGSSQGLNNPRQMETPELQWGSDANFRRTQGYLPPDHESSELIEQKRLGVLKVFSISESAATTRPPSPSNNAESSSIAVANGSNNRVKDERDADAPPAKRRKSKTKPKEELEENGDDMVSIPPRAIAKKRKSKADLKGMPDVPSPVPETNGKRRKSAANMGKQARENLTDAQKRENHIKSEQKRRGAIKEGFDDLGEITPNLKGGGYSKSTMLTIAGEWLETVLRGNEELEKLVR
ncbi:hypothetical protein GGR52DRAFT_61661 [Hypoxylon sp. FL1284]|nr:hypothetical protein GGR52DRAFT_61661 [Hypoxylon sp. FL1284]